MAILNKSSDGLVSVLVALVRTCTFEGEMPRQKLLDVCCPRSLVGDSQEMGVNTLNRWCELGLFHLSQDKKIKVAEPFYKEIRKQGASTRSIALSTVRIVLDPCNNMNFWSDKENKASDFTRAVCWTLAQDVYEFTPTSHATVEPICNEQVQSSEVILLQNDTRWAGFKSWAEFLGFGRSESGRAQGAFLTDPTPVVASYILQCLPTKDAVSIQEFLDRLAEAVPVLDGGHYRKEVESKLRPEKWKAPGPSAVSTSLSRALLRLQASGILRFADRSDSESRVNLIGRAGRTVQSVTHVLLGDSK